MDQTAPGVAADTFAADSWAAAKAFFDALAALPGPDHPGGAPRPAPGDDHLRRRRLPRADPARRRSSTTAATIAMIVEGGTWQRLTPAKGFLC